MGSFTRLFVVASAALLSVGMLPAGASGEAESGRQATSDRSTSSFCHSYREKELFLAERINRARKASGVTTLRLDRELSKVARKHTREMLDKGQLYHSSDRSLRRRVTNWRILGENVGLGNGADELHRAFMDSAGHRANVLYAPYRYVGVGVIRSAGRMWVTVLFESELDPGTTLKIRSC